MSRNHWEVETGFGKKRESPKVVSGLRKLCMLTYLKIDFLVREEGERSSLRTMNLKEGLTGKMRFVLPQIKPISKT